MTREVTSAGQVAGWFPDESPSTVETYRLAAESWIASRCRVPAEGPAPAALVQAVRLFVARHLARRNSPDGFIGMSELGPARIASVDRDIETLIAPYRKLVFG